MNKLTKIELRNHAMTDKSKTESNSSKSRSNVLLCDFVEYRDHCFCTNQFEVVELLDKVRDRLENEIKLKELQHKTVVGDFKLWNDGERINFVKTDGEGGSFDIDLFERCVSDFFDKNF